MTIFQIHQIAFQCHRQASGWTKTVCWKIKLCGLVGLDWLDWTGWIGLVGDGSPDRGPESPSRPKAL